MRAVTTCAALAALIPSQMIHDDVAKWRVIFHEVFR